VPLHRQKCYASLGYAAGSLPVAEAVAATCLSLPIFPELTDGQVDQVIDALNTF
jgi:dTDP-4-amino-4,6-dideoxygalactose transaminase